MIYLKIIYKTWVVDYKTYKGRPGSFHLDFGPFPNEQQAKWFWLTLKEKMLRSYDIAIIHDKDGNELCVDQSPNIQPY